MAERQLSRDDVLAVLREHKPELVARFDVVDLALFGSTARDEAAPDSDIDILVSFNGPADFDRIFGVEFYLEDLLGRPVDVVTQQAMRPELRPYIEAEAVRV